MILPSIPLKLLKPPSIYVFILMNEVRSNFNVCLKTEHQSNTHTFGARIINVYSLQIKERLVCVQCTQYIYIYIYTPHYVLKMFVGKTIHRIIHFHLGCCLLLFTSGYSLFSAHSTEQTIKRRKNKHKLQKQSNPFICCHRFVMILR